VSTMYSSTHKQLGLAVKLPNGKTIGRIEGNRFRKQIAGSRHMLQRPPAIAIDAEAYEQQIRPKVEFLEVVDTETGTVYQVSVGRFDQLKKPIDRGWGRQYYLALPLWDVVRR